MKKNIEIDYWKIARDIWVLKYWYLTLIEDTADSKNRVNMDNIELSDSNKRSLESFLKKKWFLGKFKLKWDSSKVLYLNHRYNHIWKSIGMDLYDAFNEINWGNIY